MLGSCLCMYVQLNSTSVTVWLTLTTYVREYECREVHALIKHSRNREVYGKLLSETRRLSQSSSLPYIDSYSSWHLTYR